MQLNEIQELSPVDRLAQAGRARRERFELSDTTVYGLTPSWVGHRQLGQSEAGSSTETSTVDGRRMTHEVRWIVLQLDHGDRATAGAPFACIETRVGGEPPALVEALHHAFGTLPHDQPLRPWVGTILVDGDVQHAEGARSTDLVAARIERNDGLITVLCRGWPSGVPEALVSIRDLDPYLVD